MDTNVSAAGQLVLASHPSNWTVFAGNPVLTPSQGWDSSSTLEADVLYDGGVYKMWYAGCSQTCQIGYATSSDGTTWAPYAGNPVLAANASSWDVSLGIPRVLHVGSGYRMWYEGNGPVGIRVGSATSPDGIVWTKHGTTPVFNGSMAWDQGSVNAAAVVQVGSTFVMYFSGQSTSNPGLSVGRATSTDGVNWTEYSGNPVMSPQAAWEGNRIYVSWIGYGTSGYDLYYFAGSVGTPVYIGHAMSADGGTWTRDPGNPVLRPGPVGSWDGSTVAHPFVAPVGGQVRLYFTGYNQSVMQIGFATRSPTGLAYASVGTWVSTVFDSGDANTTWSSLAWTATTPQNTEVAAALQVGNTSPPDTRWTLSRPSVTTPVTLSLPKARYARVVLALASLDGASTPSVASVQVTYELPVSIPTQFWGLGLLGFALLLILAASIAFAIVAVAILVRRAGRRPAEASPVAAVCPQCGAPTRGGQKFCERCGRQLLPPPREGPPRG